MVTTEKDGMTVGAPSTVSPSIILQPNDLSAVPDILAQISRIGAAFNAEDEPARLALLDAARKLARALEKPRETLVRHTYGHKGAFAAITVGVKAGVWGYMAEGDKPRRVTDIAIETGVDEAFLARLLKHVAAMGYIKETGQDEYCSTNFSKALSIPDIGAGYSLFSRGLDKAISSMPEFLARNGYKLPPGNFQYAHATESGMFDWLEAHPPNAVHFSNFMVGCSRGRPFWMDAGFYPVRERLIEGFNAEDKASKAKDGKGAALLVDIGGGVGRYLEEFLKKFPDVKGRLVVQDLPVVIDQIEQLDDRIERQAYDFLTPQPVTGARAYYMHSILHDWPDETCLSILANIKAAMRPGHSRLLINEKVIPDTDAQWEATGLDIMMACLLSSKERTRVEWVTLLESAGFQVNKIYSHTYGIESVIECVLPEV